MTQRTFPFRNRVSAGPRCGDALALFAPAPAALAPLLAAELDALGARRARVSGAGVAFSGDLRTAYRACLWSRLASRILLHLARVPAGDADVLYAAARELPWESHLTPDGTFAVECTVRGARIAHSHFAALRVKDAVADRFRQRCGRRPDVDLRAPDLRIHLHLRGAEGRVALDLSGEALHRRGYRVESGPAPLRETLAAALLRFSGWPDPERWPALLDPLCGSGTLLAEAALMAADVAPGLLRARFGFEGWRGHDAATWSALLAEARTRRERGLRSLPPMLGGDRDASVLEAARRNLQRCGLDAQVTLQQRGLDAWLDAPPPAPRGLLVSNPPYGGRLESGAAREALAGLAALARGPLSTWDMALLLPQDSAWPEKGVGTVLAVPNGPLRCRFQLVPSSTPAARALPAVDADAFANRLRKNERRLGRWRRREGVDCYRVYDADLPDFALAVDVYEGAGGRWAHVQEYAPPPQIDPALALQRRRLALERVARELGVVPGRVVFKTRERQRGRDQYHRRGDGDASLLEVREGEARLLVNLHDYLDTGLFLDHRPLRRWLRANAAGKRFANLFAYTGAATVAAGLGGATDTVSVDLSRVYLAWAARNLSLNGLHPPRHATVHADCRAWLDDAARRQPPFDLILVDPPTFSNSKRMRGTFDVQRDHVPLLRAALARLAPGGTLIFSCNRRGFRLDSDALGPVTVRDWTRWSLPPDFARPPPAHHCFALQPA